MIAYLSGAMERAEGEGAGWRADITHWLQTVLGHDVIDPVVESARIVALENAADYRSWRDTKPLQFRSLVQKMIARDLRAVKQESDYLICLWNHDVLKGGGTHGEITTAYDCGIPVYLVNQLPFSDLSGWIYACSTEVFASFEKLKAFLKSEYSGDGK
ncbi:MAG: hypothetical protein GXO90_10500 [FCB group bacterium]|nr:hypothetical protein [FCB group bacterium]